MAPAAFAADFLKLCFEASHQKLNTEFQRDA
jgi:hypothetical protein